MAFLFADSFDFYNPTSATTFTIDAATHWDSLSVNGAVVTTANTRFSSGVGYQFPAAAMPTAASKSSGSNDAGHHLVFAYRNNGVTTVGNGLTFTLMDGATAQCSIVFDPSGPVYLKSGLGTGAILATWNTTFSVGVWYGVEIEVIINGTVGSIAIRLNGNTANDFSATGLNTKPGTNAYANKVQIGCTSGIASNIQQIDDFLWFSTSGAAPNTWVGDIRAQQLLPTSDASAGLSNSASTAVAQTWGASIGTTPSGATANTLTTSMAASIATGGTLTALGVQFSGTYTGKYKLALYDGTTGVPTTLLAQTAEVTNSAATGVYVATNLITPLVVSVGQKVFGAIIHDSTLPSMIIQNASAYTVSQSYAGGFPSSFANAALSSINSISFQATITPSNANQVANATEDGDTTFVYGSTASVGDLYNIGSLGVTPSSIVAVQTRMCARKSDTGTRQARIQVKSGATTSNGSTVTLGTSYSYAGPKVDTVDPNTGAAWTAAAVNVLQIGPYVVA